MVPYLCLTGVSCLFIHLASRKKDKSFLKMSFIAIALLAPCILAGARDSTVGTDTLTYGEPLFIYAKYRPFSIFMENTNCEYLYSIFVFLVAKITGNIFWQYFFIELICIGFTYKALSENVSKRYLWLGMMVFHFMFYSFTLNLMRQFISLAIQVWAFKYVKQKNLFKYGLVIVITTFIQSTSIIGITVYPLYAFSTKKVNQDDIEKNRKGLKNLWITRTFFKMLVIIGSCVLVMLAGYFIPMITALTGKYAGQFEYLMDSYSIVWTNLLFMLPILGLFLLYYKKMRSIDVETEYFLVALLMSIILHQLQGVSRESYRVAFYFEYIIILIIPKIVQSIKNKSNRTACIVLLTVILSCYFYDYFVVQKFNGTIPYSSEILRIE